MRENTQRGSALLIGMLAVVAIIGITLYATQRGNDADDMMADDDMMHTGAIDAAEEAKDMMEDNAKMADEMMDDDMGGDDMMMDAGLYAPYSEDKLAMAHEGKVVLFFKASWCPSCRSVDKDIKEHLSDIPSDVTILELNYDTETDLKKKYGVTSQHTFVQVDAEGNELAQWAGSPSLASILDKIE